MAGVVIPAFSGARRIRARQLLGAGGTSLPSNRLRLPERGGGVQGHVAHGTLPWRRGTYTVTVFREGANGLLELSSVPAVLAGGTPNRIDLVVSVPPSMPAT